MVSKEHGAYVWGQLQYENPLREDVPSYREMRDEFAGHNLGPFRFRADEYERVLGEASRTALSVARSTSGKRSPPPDDPSDDAGAGGEQRVDPLLRLCLAPPACPDRPAR